MSHYLHYFINTSEGTPPRTARISGLKMMVKSGLALFILKSYVPLQGCCCPVQKNLPRMAELAWQVSRYL